MGLSTAPLSQVAHRLGRVTAFNPGSPTSSVKLLPTDDLHLPTTKDKEHLPNLAFPGLSVREALPIPAFKHSSNILSFHRTALSQLLLLWLLLITSSSYVLPCM